MLEELEYKSGGDNPRYAYDHARMKQKTIGSIYFNNGNPLPKDVDMRQQNMCVQNLVPINGYHPVYLHKRGFNYIEQAYKEKHPEMSAMQVKKRPRYTINKKVEAAAENLFRDVIRPRQSILDDDRVALEQLKLAAGISRGPVQPPMNDSYIDGVFKTYEAQTMQGEMLAGNVGQTHVQGPGIGALNVEGAPEVQLNKLRAQGIVDIDMSGIKLNPVGEGQEELTVNIQQPRINYRYDPNVVPRDKVEFKVKQPKVGISYEGGTNVINPAARPEFIVRKPQGGIRYLYPDNSQDLYPEDNPFFQIQRPAGIDYQYPQGQQVNGNEFQAPQMFVKHPDRIDYTYESGIHGVIVPKFDRIKIANPTIKLDRELQAQIDPRTLQFNQNVPIDASAFQFNLTPYGNVINAKINEHIMLSGLGGKITARMADDTGIDLAVPSDRIVPQIDWQDENERIPLEIEQRRVRAELEDEDGQGGIALKVGEQRLRAELEGDENIKLGVPRQAVEAYLGQGNGIGLEVRPDDVAARLSGVGQIELPIAKEMIKAKVALDGTQFEVSIPRYAVRGVLGDSGDIPVMVPSEQIQGKLKNGKVKLPIDGGDIHTFLKGNVPLTIDGQNIEASTLGNIRLQVLSQQLKAELDGVAKLKILPDAYFEYKNESGDTIPLSVPAKAISAGLSDNDKRIPLKILAGLIDAEIKSGKIKLNLDGDQITTDIYGQPVKTRINMADLVSVDFNNDTLKRKMTEYFEEVFKIDKGLIKMMANKVNEQMVRKVQGSSEIMGEGVQQAMNDLSEVIATKVFQPLVQQINLTQNRIQDVVGQLNEEQLMGDTLVPSRGTIINNQLTQIDNRQLHHNLQQYDQRQVHKYANFTTGVAQQNTSAQAPVFKGTNAEGRQLNEQQYGNELPPQMKALQSSENVHIIPQPVMLTSVLQTGPLQIEESKRELLALPPADPSANQLVPAQKRNANRLKSKGRTLGSHVTPEGYITPGQNGYETRDFRKIDVIPPQLTDNAVASIQPQTTTGEFTLGKAADKKEEEKAKLSTVMPQTRPGRFDASASTSATLEQKRAKSRASKLSVVRFRTPVGITPGGPKAGGTTAGGTTAGGTTAGGTVIVENNKETPNPDYLFNTITPGEDMMGEVSQITTNMANAFEKFGDKNESRANQYLKWMSTKMTQKGRQNEFDMNNEYGTLNALKLVNTSMKYIDNMEETIDSDEYDQLVVAFADAIDAVPGLRRTLRKLFEGRIKGSDGMRNMTQEEYAIFDQFVPESWAPWLRNQVLQNYDPQHVR